jgi:hypothetical protein
VNGKEKAHQITCDASGKRVGKVLIHEGPQRQCRDNLDLRFNLRQHERFIGMSVRIIDARVPIHWPLAGHQRLNVVVHEDGA